MAEPLSLQWDQCASWIEHIIALADGIDRFGQRFEEFDIPVEVASLLVDGATYLWERGLLDECQNLRLTAKAIVEGRACDQHLVATVYGFHACILSSQGIWKKRWYISGWRREQLQATKNTKQPRNKYDKIRLANAFNNLAGVCCSLGKFDEAMVYNQLSLKIKAHWANALDLQYLESLSYQNLGILHGHTGRFDEAAKYFDKAIELGANTRYTLRTALTYHNYGCMKVLRGRIETASHMFEKAYELQYTSLGDHYDTAATLHMLAACWLHATTLQRINHLCS
ncbi:hypothetical protein GQ44DRAFT_730590 [Phaeosphaeriaceae sp. PMI808]|nr:hypothetical protein GQ44DRAFT_730590 [Phaeosphaeriaceae sp. PMI808]